MTCAACGTTAAQHRTGSANCLQRQLDAARASQPSPEALASVGKLLDLPPHQRVFGLAALQMKADRADAASAREARLREVLDKAPHGFACASFTIIEGKPPLCAGDPLPVYRQRIPPDASLCDCWKRAALAPSDVPCQPPPEEKP